MAYQLSVPSPLAHPERFEQAHRLVMRGLEVLDRNGGRKPSTLPKLGPLKPAASWFIQLITRYIVRSHQVNVADNLARLYARREANCRWGSDEMHMLRRARFQAERLAPGYKRKSLGLPTFLVGGAVISGAVGALQAFGDILARREAHPRADDAPAVRPLHPHLVRHPLLGRHLAAPHPREHRPAARRALRDDRGVRQPAEGPGPNVRGLRDHPHRAIARALVDRRLRDPLPSAIVT